MGGGDLNLIELDVYEDDLTRFYAAEACRYQPFS